MYYFTINNYNIGILNAKDIKFTHLSHFSIQLYTENFYTIYFFMDYLVVALEKYYYNTLYWVYNQYLNV